MTLTRCDYKSMELDCLLLQIFWEMLSECCLGAKADRMAALPYLVPAEGRFKLRILAESFAFRRNISPLTAIPMQNEVRRLPNDWKVKNLTRLEFVLTFVKTGQWESFIHNVVTWYYDSFESHTFNSYSLCNQLIDLFRDLVSVVLKYKINARQKTYLGFSAL